MEELKQCPKCQEFYSSTYRACPFCDEMPDDKGEVKVTPRRRKGHRESGHRATHSARGIIICILLFALLLMLWYLFGSDVIAKLQGQDAGKPKKEITEVVDDGKKEDDVDVVPDDETEPDDEEIRQPSSSSDKIPDAEKTTDTTPDTTPEKTPEKTPDTTPVSSSLTLNRSDFTLGANESFQLKVNGSTGKATWTVDNPNVVKVDENGKVTAVGGGHTTVTATVGGNKGTCIVRVQGMDKVSGNTAPAANTATPDANTATPAGGAVSFSKEDVTIKVGESFKLKVNGSTATPTWGVSNNALVSVDQNGTVKGLAQGTATVQATVNGTKLSCIVRVK